MKRAMRLLAVRARSCHEIRDRLLRAGFHESTARAVELRLVDVGLLDDAEFAAQVARRGAETGKSARLTRRDLQRFGIGADLADDTFAGVDEDGSDEERALKLAKGKVATCRHLPADKAAARVVRHLLGKGYGPHLAWEVTRRAFDALEFDGD